MEDAEFNSKEDVATIKIAEVEELKASPRAHWPILVVIGSANILLNAVGTMQAPFYPREAQQKGATATEFSFVFSVFQLSTFFTSPFAGTLLGYMNPVLLYLIGVCLTSVCTILFGFLGWLEGHVTFISLSIILRLIEGCGTAIFFTAAFTIIASKFPSYVAVTFGMIQTCAGVGLIIGPSLGGLLFEIGGFPLPFIFIGILLAISAIIAKFVLADNLSREIGKNSKKLGFINLIKIPAIALNALSILFCACGIGFLEATLEPHVRQNFGLSPFLTGLIFIIAGGTYAVTSPIWGRLCDIGWCDPLIITLVGYSLTFVSFLIVGPPPGILKTTLWGVCLGQAIHGMGAGATLISARMQASKNALLHGYPDNLATFGLISSLWVASYSLGNFIGPSIGGVLLDQFGFRAATLFILVGQGIVILLLLISTYKSNFCKR